jgi:hypothetical protein
LSRREAWGITNLYFVIPHLGQRWGTTIADVVEARSGGSLGS